MAHVYALHREIPPSLRGESEDHARMQEFSSGGGGGRSGQSDIKSSDNVFLSSTYFTEVQRLLSKKLSFSKVPEEVLHFRGGGGGGGGPISSRGGWSCPIAYSLYETHITCDFPVSPSESAHEDISIRVLK